MKKSTALVFTIIFSMIGYSQIESAIYDAVSSFNKRETGLNQSRYHGKFLSMIKENERDSLLAIYCQEEFHSLMKILYLNGKCQWALETETDSDYLTILEEIRSDLPDEMDLSPTSTQFEEGFSDYVTDTWIYTNRLGQKCEISAHFVDGVFKSIGYQIYK